MDELSKFPVGSIGALLWGLGYLINATANWKKNAQPNDGMSRDKILLLLNAREEKIMKSVRQLLEDKGI